MFSLHRHSGLVQNRIIDSESYICVVLEILAVREGFEPTISETRYNAFRERRLQPLGHLTTTLLF